MKRVVAGLLAIVIAMSPVSAGAQSDEPTLPSIEQLSVLSVTRDAGSGEVEIVALAPADLVLGGREIPARSVQVIVNGEPLAAEFESVPADQLDVIMVIDTSGSMANGPIEAAREAALSFVRTMPAAVSIGVVAFNETVSVPAPLGSSPQQLSEAIDSLEAAGDTALHDAAIEAVRQFGPPTGFGQRVVVLLTDGADDGSQATISEAVGEVSTSGVDLFAVALGANVDTPASLEPLVDVTSGELLAAESESDLRPLYDNLAAQLASQFTIRFTPTDPAGDVSILVDHLGVLAGATVSYDAYVPPVVATTTPIPVVNDEPEVALAAPVVSVVEGPTWLRSKTARNVGIGALSLMLLLGGLMLSFPSDRMVALAQTSRSRAEVPHVSGLTERLESAADRALENRGQGRLLSNTLERAGIDLRPAEFVVIAGASAVTIGLMLWLIAGPIVAIAGLAIAFFGARAWVARKASKRVQAFVDQLPQTLQLLAGSLRAGHALPQAAETVARETPTPTGDEFHRLVTEHRLGRDFGEAMGAMQERVDSEDFAWVVRAIDIHREVGGDLAEVLDNVNSTIRDRNYIRRQFSALSAEGRYSAYLIVSLPFVATGFLSITNPTYVGKLFEGARGFYTVSLALGLILVGWLWMRALMKVKF